MLKEKDIVNHEATLFVFQLQRFLLVGPLPKEAARLHQESVEDNQRRMREGSIWSEKTIQKSSQKERNFSEYLYFGGGGLHLYNMC